MRRRAGFTLTEFLLVIAVLGILGAGFGVGLRLLNAAQLTEAINLVESQVAEARRLAKRLDRDVTLQINQAGGVWRVVVDGTPRNLPASASVTTGTVNITLQAPHGTYAGGQFNLGLTVRGVSATVTVTGVLARTVVQR